MAISGADERRHAHPADLPQAHGTGSDGARHPRHQARDQREDALPDAARMSRRAPPSKADVKGYYVGGKTGTSEKVVGGRYSKTRLLNSFTAVLPADQPRYLVLIMLDEPQASAGNPWLCDLGMERGADRRRCDCPHCAALGDRAAL